MASRLPARSAPPCSEPSLAGGTVSRAKRSKRTRPPIGRAGARAGSRSRAGNIGLVGPGRVHALIDGVFAIAMTLLVLDLPALPGSAHFVHRFVESWPSYAAYVVSFATIALIWIEHHGMTSSVRFVNR